MVKWAVLFSFLFCAISAFSQSRALRSAKKSFESGELNEAQLVIEEAKSHAKTKGQARTWHLSYLIYESLYQETDILDRKVEYCQKQLDSYSRLSTLEKSAEYQKKLQGKVDSLLSDIDQMLEKDLNDEIRVVMLQHNLRGMNILGLADNEIYYELGEAYRAIGEVDSALKYYDRSIEVDYKLYESLRAKLDILSRQSRYEDLVDVLDIAAGLYPDDENIALAEVHYLIDKQLFIKARSLLTSYLMFQKNSASGYHLLGYVYDQLNLTEESVDAYVKAIELGESSFDAYYTIGRHYYQRGKLFMDDSLKMEAKEYLEMAESIEPGNEQLLGTLEQFYLDRRDITNYQRVRAKRKN